MSETAKQRLSGVALRAFLGERLLDEEWKAIEEIGTDNGHVSDGDGEGIRCEYCDARIVYRREDPENGELFDWYERGYLSKRCISPEDREWIRASFAKIANDIERTKEQARKRGLSDATIEWAMEESGLEGLIDWRGRGDD